MRLAPLLTSATVFSASFIFITRFGMIQQAGFVLDDHRNKSLSLKAMKKKVTGPLREKKIEGPKKVTEISRAPCFFKYNVEGV